MIGVIATSKSSPRYSRFGNRILKDRILVRIIDLHYLTKNVEIVLMHCGGSEIYRYRQWPGEPFFSLIWL